jgi:hypothetical protein
MVWIYEIVHAINRHFKFLSPVIEIEYRRDFDLLIVALYWNNRNILKANFTANKSQKSKRRFYYNEFTVFVIFNHQIFADTENIEGSIKFCLC